jgi:hypothetical protein
MFYSHRNSLRKDNSVVDADDNHFHGETRRLPLAAQVLKTRYGLADSFALAVAELAGYPIVTEA